MGETRVKKSKKASKQTDDATRHASKKLEKLNLNNDSNTTLVPNSEASSSPTQVQESPIIKDEYEDEDDNLKADTTYTEIQTTEHKGLAIFAARKIPTGTLVIVEIPLIRLTQAEEDTDKNNSSTSALDTQFAALPKPTQKTYLSLYDSQKSDFSRLKSIYYSNCYNLSGKNKPSKSSPGGSCIGVTASRINHSCIPNVQFSFDEGRNLMVFHAIRPIPKGRELVSNYDAVFEVRAQRWRRQMLYYGFRCGCEACEGGEGGFWGRSDERRRGMVEGMRVVGECEREWEERGALGVGLDPVEALVRVEELLVKEGLVGLPLADVYRGLVKWCERLGDEVAVRKWRVRELEVCVNCLGRRAGRVEELKRKLESGG